MTYMQWTIFHTKRKCTKCRSYIFREVSSVHWLVMTREMQPSSASSSGQSLHSSKSPMNLSLCIYIQKVIFWWNLLCFDKVCNMLCVVKLELQLIMAFELQYCIHCCAWRLINFGLNNTTCRECWPSLLTHQLIFSRHTRDDWKRQKQNSIGRRGRKHRWAWQPNSKHGR